MRATKETMYAVTITRILLGLLMVIPGLAKLFIMGPNAVTGMLGGIGFPAPSVFAWILILSEIVFGLAVLANYKLRLTTIPPMIILLVAAFATAFNMQSAPSFILHLAAVSMYWVYGAYDNE